MRPKGHGAQRGTAAGLICREQSAALTLWDHESQLAQRRKRGWHSQQVPAAAFEMPQEVPGLAVPAAACLADRCCGLAWQKIQHLLKDVVQHRFPFQMISPARLHLGHCESVLDWIRSCMWHSAGGTSSWQKGLCEVRPQLFNRKSDPIQVLAGPSLPGVELSQAGMTTSAMCWPMMLYAGL